MILLFYTLYHISPPHHAFIWYILHPASALTSPRFPRFSPAVFTPRRNKKTYNTPWDGHLRDGFSTALRADVTPKQRCSGVRRGKQCRCRLPGPHGPRDAPSAPLVLVLLLVAPAAPIALNGRPGKCYEKEGEKGGHEDDAESPDERLRAAADGCVFAFGEEARSPAHDPSGHGGGQEVPEHVEADLEGGEAKRRGEAECGRARCGVGGGAGWCGMEAEVGDVRFCGGTTTNKNETAKRV